MNHVKVRSHTKHMSNSTLLYFYSYLFIKPDNVYLVPKHVHKCKQDIVVYNKYSCVVEYFYQLIFKSNNRTSSIKIIIYIPVFTFGTAVHL